MLSIVAIFNGVLALVEDIVTWHQETILCDVRYILEGSFLFLEECLGIPI
jgi:hypothetical protein